MLSPIEADSLSQGVHQGYGLHLWLLGPEYVMDFFKNLYTGEILYTLVLCFAKYSILAFYQRIFARNIRIPVYILAGFVTAWGIAVVRHPSHPLRYIFVKADRGCL